MARDDRVGDVSAVQATPPCEIHLAADIQNVHKMVVDHITLTSLALHRLFPFVDIPTILCDHDSAAFSFIQAFISGGKEGISWARTTPPTAVCQTFLHHNFVAAYATNLLLCSIILPIDVLASFNM
jgi:hypothetical protein